MKKPVHITGSVLEWAIEQSGLRPEEIAQRLGVRPSAIALDGLRAALKRWKRYRALLLEMRDWLKRMCKKYGAATIQHSITLAGLLTTHKKFDDPDAKKKKLKDSIAKVYRTSSVGNFGPKPPPIKVKIPQIPIKNLPLKLLNFIVWLINNGQMNHFDLEVRFYTTDQHIKPLQAKIARDQAELDAIKKKLAKMEN